jgi:Tfp pilus assembly pilus retraction ATPase PilT
VESFDELISAAIDRRPPIMHLCAGAAPTARVDGSLQPLGD